MMIDEKFNDEYEISHFILLMMTKIPVGSIWLILDYLDDLFTDFASPPSSSMSIKPHHAA
jgi:hypothetical protein